LIQIDRFGSDLPLLFVSYAEVNNKQVKKENKGL